MKILLISPPIFDYYYTPARKEPLGLFYIKSALDLIPGLHVEIHDALLSGKVKTIQRPDCFRYLDDIYTEDTSLFSLFHAYHRFGDSFAAILRKIRDRAYDIIGIAALFSAYFPDVELLIRLIKEQTRACVVVGGWAVDAEGERLFAGSAADVFLFGPGEVAFPAFATALIRNRPLESLDCIMFRRNGAIVSRPAKTQAAIPDLIPRRTGAYFFAGKRIAKMVISRGCNHRCEFCTIHRMQHFSRRPIESIEEELNSLTEQGIEIVDFEDDNLFHDKTFTGALIPLLEKYHKKGLSYMAMNGITAVDLLPYTGIIGRIGFRELNLSLVTADASAARGLKRPVDMETVRTIAQSVQGKIPTLVFLILGLPGMTPDMALRDIIELAHLPVTIGVSPLYPVPGVPFFDRLSSPADRRTLRGSALSISTPAYIREDIASLWKLTRMINRIKSPGSAPPGMLSENLKFFGRSIREKSWYRRTKQGAWVKGFAFSVDLPERVEICVPGGGISKVSFTE